MPKTLPEATWRGALAEALGPSISEERPGPEWFTAEEAAREFGCTRASISARLNRMRSEGRAESEPRMMNGRIGNYWRIIK